MRTFYLFVICALSFAPSAILAQCSNFNANYPTGLFITTDQNWYTATNCASGGDFQRFEVIQGAKYEFRTCGTLLYNTEITLWNASHTTVLAYETSNCGLIHGYITWTATYTGEVHLLVSQEGCQTNASCAKVQFRRKNYPTYPPNNNPCASTPISVGKTCSYTQVIQAGASYSSVTRPSCADYTVNDVWYKAIVPPSGSMVFSTAEGTVTDAAMAIYAGQCSNPAEIACNDDFNDLMPQITQTGLTPGTTIYIRLWSFENRERGTLDLCVFEICNSAPNNDLPCAARSIQVGESLEGTNGCATDISESWTPSCWSHGDVNSVWYAFTAPSGGEVQVSTTTLDGFATQLAVLSGDCASPNEIACNMNSGEGCGSTGSSSLIVSALTPGERYFIMVDGQDDQEGFFELSLSSITSVIPQTGSDCSQPIALCGDFVSVADPGPQGTGAICDFNGANDCTEGEKNSIWYEVTIGADGPLNFTILPNDASTGACGTETNYDFVLWKIAGNGTTTDCATMQSNSSTGLLACNYSDLGVTGLASGGNRPSGYSACFDDSFEPTVNVKKDDVLLLVIQNYQGSTSGFSLDFASSGLDVVLTGKPSTVYWYGGHDDTWNEPENWGNCKELPACDVNAVIPSASTSTPRMAGEYYVKDLTIEPGAELRIVAGTKLHLCGDFKNYGRLIMDPSATILFDNWAVNQELIGNLTGNNSIGNLIIEKSGGVVRMESNVEMKGDFITANINSVFNVRGNELRIGGDFLNFGGNTTFTGSATTGKVLFNGTSTQEYSQGNADLSLNQVEVLNSGGGVSLQTDIEIRAISGRLILDRGVIHTGEHMVIVRNTSPDALNEGSFRSYIEGTLRRYPDQTGLFHFPVGHSATGYQRADINFRSHGFSYITATYSPWSTLGAPLGVTDCTATFNMDALDNGYFTLTANINPTSGDYDMVLYNYNYGNQLGSQGWTIMKDSGAGWMLDGYCGESSADVVQRFGLSGFSRFATAQASTPLPIELLSFGGYAALGGNQLQWVTAVEIDNERFVIESADDAVHFETVIEMPGAGNSSNQISYRYLDEAAQDGITYYRLKQVDYNGDYSYSDIIAVERTPGEADIEIYPNPVEEEFYIESLGGITQIAEVRITDPLGRLLLKRNWPVRGEDTYRMRIDARNLRQGLYTLSCYSEKGERIYQAPLIKR